MTAGIRGKRLWRTSPSILGGGTWERSLLVPLHTPGSFLFHFHLLTSKLPTLSSPSASRLLFSIDFAAGYFQAQTSEHRESLSNNSSEGFVATNTLDLRKTIMIVASIIRDLQCCCAEALSILLNPLIDTRGRVEATAFCLLTHVEMNTYRCGVMSPEPLKLEAEFKLMPSSDQCHFRTLEML